jgi:hypothetical protein
MKQYLLLYSGPPVPRDASHERWPAWFGLVGAALVDRGSPMTGGVVLRPDGSTTDDAGPFRGYSVIQADDRDTALELAREHPLLAVGPDYTLELFELPSK